MKSLARAQRVLRAACLLVLAACGTALLRPDLFRGVPLFEHLHPAITGQIADFDRWPHLQSSSRWEGPDAGPPGDTWAVIVQSSRYWFNYRHASNALIVYRELKARGVPDSHIILMMSHDHACDPRNRVPCTLFERTLGDPGARNLWEDVEVDFYGPEVSPETFLHVMQGRGGPEWPAGKVLASGPRSNVIVYLTGHSHADIMKFQDKSVITSLDVESMVETMELQGRYRELLFVVDTCQASTLSRLVASPGFTDVSSSIRGESSYSFVNDYFLGQSVVDQMTYVLGNVLRAPAFMAGGGATMADLVRALKAEERRVIHSTVIVRQTTDATRLDRVPVDHFFGWPSSAGYVAA